MQDYFFVRVNRKNVKVSFKDILYVEASKCYVQIVTTKEKYMVLMTLRQMEEILPEESFCRVHKSFIISLDQVASFDNHCVYFNDQVSVPVGHMYKQVLGKRFKVICSDVRRQPANLVPFTVMGKVS